jgi:hypothetical protein
LFKRAGDQIDQKTGIVKRDGMTIDPKSRAFQFGQGQSLTAIINQMILSSDYAKKAITDKPSPEGYIKWFKLDVQVELLKYDPIVGDYAKKITFRVVPYFVHQSIFANPSSAPVGYSELMKTVVKEYQYIYTGQNVDVLKFDIKINNLFYVGTNPSPENQGAQTSNQDQKLAEQKNKTTKTGQGQAPAAQAAQMGRARPHRKYLYERFKKLGILEQSLWTMLDSRPCISRSFVLPNNGVNLMATNSELRCLPKHYEVPLYKETTISPVPLKGIPLILLAVANCDAVLAFPLSVAPINDAASTMLNLLVPEVAVTFPVKFPANVADIVPAENPPSLFLATTLPITFDGEASTAQVVSVDPSKSLPVMYVPFISLFVVEDLTVIFC